MKTTMGKFWAVALGALMMLGVAATVSSHAAGANPIGGSRNYATACGSLQTYDSVTPGWKNIRWTSRPYGDSWISINGGSANRAGAIGVYLGSRTSFTVQVTCVRSRDCAIQTFSAY